MNKLLLICILNGVYLLNAFSQISDATIFANQNWVHACAVEGDTIWAATSGGLVKWHRDGTRLASYYKTDGLMHNILTAIAIDHEGNKWIGTRDGGLIKFDGHTFTGFTYMQNFHHEVSTIVVDPDNKLWIGNMTSGVFTFDQGTWQHFTKSNSGLVGNQINAICRDHNGTMWFGTPDGVSCYDGSEWTTLNPSEYGLPENLYVYSIAKDENNDIWLGYLYGLSRISGQSVTHYTSTEIPLLESTSILSIVAENDTLWLNAGMDHGIIKWVIPTEEYIVHNWSNSPLLPGRVQHVFLAQDGTKYFSTGDLYIDGGVSSFNGSVWINYSTESPFGMNFIMALHEDPSGNIWVGTYGGGASVYDGNTWLKHEFLGYVHQVRSDHRGHQWFATFNGIWEYDGTSWTNHTEMSEGIPGGKAYDLEFDRQGNLWVAFDGEGAARYDGENWQVFRTDNSGISSNSLYKLAVDSTGSIWFGSFDNGLSVFDGNAWLVYNMENSVIQDNYVTALEAGQNGGIWAGIRNNGLFHIEDNKWTHYQTGYSGPQSNWIESVLEDTQGLVWAGCSRNDFNGGVSVLMGSIWKHYSIANSALVDQPVISILHSSDNYYWMGTYFGITRWKHNIYNQISSLEEKESTRLIPNPATDRLVIHHGEKYATLLVRVLDLSGKTVLEQTISGDQNEMDIRSLKPGLYILTGTGKTGNLIFRNKFVKN